jgi:hypothetical protein
MLDGDAGEVEGFDDEEAAEEKDDSPDSWGMPGSEDAAEAMGENGEDPSGIWEEMRELVVVVVVGEDSLDTWEVQVGLARCSGSSEISRFRSKKERTVSFWMNKLLGYLVAGSSYRQRLLRKRRSLVDLYGVACGTPHRPFNRIVRCSGSVSLPS